MNKVFEYLAVSAASIVAFFLFGALISQSYMSGTLKDCESMGQSRFMEMHIKCEVVKP